MTSKERNAELARERLAIDLRAFSADELRWDFHCNIHDPQKALILAELERRGEPTDGPRSRRGGAAWTKAALRVMNKGDDQLRSRADPCAAAIAACRAVVDANDRGMTAEEGRRAVELCRAVVADADAKGAR